MAKIIEHPTMYHSVSSDEKQYIKTFDCTDDPIVYTITRCSIYSDDTICGVFDSEDTVMVRLKRLMQTPRDGDKFIVEAHNLRNINQEEDLNCAHHTHKNA